MGTSPRTRSVINFQQWKVRRPNQLHRQAFHDGGNQRSTTRNPPQDPQRMQQVPGTVLGPREAALGRSHAHQLPKGLPPLERHDQNSIQR